MKKQISKMKRVKTKCMSCFLAAMVTLSLLPATVFAVPAAENEAAEKPYVIRTVDDLKTFRDEVNNGNNYSGKTVVLDANIDLGGTDFGYPIAVTADKSFKGIFDGCGYQVTGLYTTNRGLFGYLGEGGVIRNLSVSGEIPFSGDYVGGVVGRNNAGLVENCYTDVQISDSSSGSGGVVGYNGSDGTVRNCYSVGDVTGFANYAGGVVGQNYGTIENCYSIGNVSGRKNVGGIAGLGGGTITNCYSIGAVTGGTNGGAVGSNSGTYSGLFYSTDEYTGGSADPEGVTGIPTADFASMAFSGWDLETVWKIDSTLGRPVLRTIPENGSSGTEDDPHVISNKADLEAFRDSVNDKNDYSGEYVLLTADINLNGSEESQWEPISQSNILSFKGTFNGGGHEITGLYINNSETYYQGLFGYVHSSAKIENLSVSGDVTSTNQNVGGVAGTNKGQIINCHSSVNVTGGAQTGGIVGSNDGTIEDCSYQTGTVTGSDSYVGGIVGMNGNGMIRRCFNTGTVNGVDYVGGITGSNGRQGMEYCYNTGVISGNNAVGGLAGFNFGSTSHSYSAGTVTGKNEVGYLFGMKQGNVTNSYFLSDTFVLERKGGISKTSEQFASGEVAYLLNNKVTDGTQAFYQTCGEGLPAFSGKTVYQVKSYSCPGDTVGKNIYSNTDQNVTGDHSYTKETAEDKYLKQAATCTDAAVYYKSCANCGEGSITDTFVYGEELGHDWGEPVWNWSDDGKAATATFTCENDSEHVETPTVTVTPEVKTPATCTEKGTTIYTAEVNFDGNDYICTKDVEDIDPLGHDMQKTDRVEPTCTTDGKEAYYTCDNCKKHFSDAEGQNIIEDLEQYGVLEATGHDWGEPVWNWSDDGKAATATFTCNRDSNHTETPTVTVTPEVKTPATCTEKGTTTYTAAVELEGKTYTATEDVTDIPAAGHGEIETVNAKEATCTAEGYTGDKVCKVCGEVLEAGKTIAKTVHTFEDGKCTVCEAADPDYVPTTPDKPDNGSPQTGDNSNMALWVGLLIVSGGALFSLYVGKKKRENT